MDLDVMALIKDEGDRKTTIGIEMAKMAQGNKLIPASMKVQMLKKIIYSGQPAANKFILTGFPDTVDDVDAFEKSCSRVKAIMYPSGGTDHVAI